MIQTCATGSINKSLDVFLWNGLFVKKGTPDAVKDKIIAVAKKTVMGAKAQKLAKDTGAQVYWMSAADAEAQIIKDRKTVAGINAMLK